ncbi:MAG: HipA domain-containing protein [Muribaculaceae bacterium]|nr:HipA domain-containing protein [Muribaculaceae bacterium]
MDKTGKWKLSPAYDMGFAYNPKGGWTSKHQMSINGKFDDITRRDLLEFALRNNIKDAAEIIDSITDSASQWPIIAKECGVPQSMIDMILPEMKLTI